MTTPTRAAALADLEAAVVPSWMASQIAADAAASRFAQWGRSTVIDENTGEPVISRELFDELHELAGLAGPASGGSGLGASIAWPIGNAGLLHVYGYLLSTADTPYGRKRDRWVDGGVARAFGLPADAFAPWFLTPSANGSTPLERITAVAEPFVADPADGDFTELWIDETGHDHSELGLDLRSNDGAGAGDGANAGAWVRAELARTVVVRDEDSGATALLYAVGTLDAPLLVTLFPLDGFGPDWLEGAAAGAPRLRYNAVDGRNEASAPLADREVTLRNE